jgi:hypothetical protein
MADRLRGPAGTDRSGDTGTVGRPAIKVVVVA